MTHEEHDGTRLETHAERDRRGPEVLLFDVNETLSDLSPLGERFVEVGAPDHLATTWFAGLLRDGFALAAAGSSATFAEIGAGLLRAELTGLALDREMEEAVEHVMAGFGSLELHPDVGNGIAALADRGFRLVALTNGSTGVAEDLLERTGTRARFEQVLSVEEAGVWKPAPASYGYALDRCGVAASAAMLVAVHPWDVDGAGRAGLATAWVDRAGVPFPTHFRAPGLRVDGVDHLARLLS